MSVPSHSSTPFINLFYRDTGFQQDTFATDSLRQILALLTSLDSHSFSLLTSLSLTQRSRVKDLWIFTGPVSEGSLPVETPDQNSAVPNMRRLPLQGFSTEAEPTAQMPSPQHLQATKDSPQRPQFKSPQPHLLRKPAPRAQVPVSVSQDYDIIDERPQVLRAYMPSTISSGVENMTGVGALGLKRVQVGGPTAHGHSDLQPRSNRAATPPDTLKPTPHSNAENKNSIPSTNNLSSPPLGMNVFKDFTPSSNTITPTGSYKKDEKLEQGRLNPSHSSSRPMSPTGWQSTQVDEKQEGTELSASMSEKKKSSPLTPIHQNNEAPAIITPDMSLSKSEAALVGIIASTSHVPSIPESDKSRMKESRPSLGSGQGWVLVNVEGSAARPESAGPSDTSTSQSDELQRFNSSLSRGFSPSTSKSPALEQSSPAAKAIVIIDAMDSKRKKRSTMQPKENSEGNTGLKRFFSLNKNMMS